MSNSRASGSGPARRTGRRRPDTQDGRDDIEVEVAALHTDEIGNDIQRGVPRFFPRLRNSVRLPSAYRCFMWIAVSVGLRKLRAGQGHWRAAESRAAEGENVKHGRRAGEGLAKGVSCSDSMPDSGKRGGDAMHVEAPAAAEEDRAADMEVLQDNEEGVESEDRLGADDGVGCQAMFAFPARLPASVRLC